MFRDYMRRRLGLGSSVPTETPISPIGGMRGAVDFQPHPMGGENTGVVPPYMGGNSFDPKNPQPGQLPKEYPQGFQPMGQSYGGAITPTPVPISPIGGMRGAVDFQPPPYQQAEAQLPAPANMPNGKGLMQRYNPYQW